MSERLSVAGGPISGPQQRPDPVDSPRARHVSARALLSSESLPIPALAMLGLLFVAFGIGNPKFLTSSNLSSLLDQAAVPTVLAIGLTFVLLMGSIDLSLQGVVAATSMGAALLVQNNRNANDLGLWAVVLVVVLGACLGLVGGLACTVVRIPSFLATIGTWQIGLGIAQVLFGVAPPRVRDPHFMAWETDRWLGVSRLCWVAAAVLLIGLGLQRWTRFGRYSYVIGAGPDTARLSGINVERFRTRAFVVSGACAGLAGAMMTSRTGVGAVANGDGWLFLTIAGVVIGGTLLTGGRGGVLHSFAGVMIMVTITDGMILAGISSYVQQAVQGGIVIVAVGATMWRQRARLRTVQ